MRWGEGAGDDRPGTLEKWSKNIDSAEMVLDRVPCGCVLWICWWIGCDAKFVDGRWVLGYGWMTDE